MYMQNPSEKGQASVDVEITPEMIEAGVAATLEYYSEDLFEAREQVVKGVFLAMISASRNLFEARFPEPCR